MRITLKELIYQILFFACIAAPYLNNYELTFATWSLAVLVSLKNRYSLDILAYIGCFMAIIFVALISGLFEDTRSYEFIRDASYLLKPVLGLLAGYQLCRDKVKNPLKLLVYTGIIIAILHLIIVSYSVVVLHARSMQRLRQYSGYFSDFEVYAIIVLLFRKQLQFKISAQASLFWTGVLAMSIFFYLARTNFIQFGILFLALKGYLVMNRRSVAIMSSFVLIVLLGYGAIYASNPSRSAKGFEGFLFKIKNAPIEPFKTKINVNDFKDFNDNYRSYETILTLRQVPLRGTNSILFGEGMGSSVDLKKKVWLLSSYIRYIPFLHNGFMTVFLKSGITGILILLYSISLFFRYKRSDDVQIQTLTYLLIGTGIYMILSYWVFIGFYFVADTKSVAIGFLICYREHLIRNKNAAIV
jgi:hypothetical protein